MIRLYISILQAEWDMTPESALIAVIGFIIWMIFALPAAIRRKERQDRAYAARKGITYEKLLQNRANTAARKISSHTKKMVFEKYNYQCNYCYSTFDLHIDHIFPFSKYRDNSFENLQILCKNCNLKKGSSEPNPKLHPELFGENAKGSMKKKYQTVEAFKDENLTPEQIKTLKEVEDIFSKYNDNS